MAVRSQPVRVYCAWCRRLFETRVLRSPAYCCARHRLLAWRAKQREGVTA